MVKLKLGNIIDEAKAKTRMLKSETLALYLAIRRKDVPWYAKVVLVLVVGYALSPIDLIPDFIPVLGYLDDLILVPLGITIAVKLVPKEILEECRQQAIEKFSAGKPKNWIAGGFIIAVWLLSILWVVSMILGW